ncbi:ornithine cyclodeaminase family protein [Gorillibacterium massiliense]|uniref:ornithine cyclodeaminase family protein n=1 Tax=Gorillibacterium massiliense TaxID=1280390 RepID=UPI0004B9BF95|nr:ornithine cyclodeaminase family protein [Gorillibacterium massiliense]
MLVINQNEAEELLPMNACISIMEKVLADLSTGQAVQNLRQVLPLHEAGLIGIMPGYLKGEETAGAKIISVFPDNHKRGLPSHQGIITLFDAATGAVKALVDGRKITAIRTAAVSAAATRLLARENATELAILGSGEQAASHLRAMLLARPIRRVRVWSPTPEHARAFQQRMSPELEAAAVELAVAADVRTAVEGADVICTVTAATEPVLRGEWLKGGAHINAVGACRAADRELDGAAVARSRLYVDRREAALSESGDYLLALAEGAIPESHIIGEIGELLAGHAAIAGRTSDSEITLFKSLGLAVEDLAAAQFIYQEAIQQKRGVDIAL